MFAETWIEYYGGLFVSALQTTKLIITRTILDSQPLLAYTFNTDTDKPLEPFVSTFQIELMFQSLFKSKVHTSVRKLSIRYTLLVI